MPWVLWVLGGAAALRAGVGLLVLWDGRRPARAAALRAGAGLLVLWDGRRPARAAAPAEPAPPPATGW